MNLFFELLQLALGTRKELSRVPSARKWRRLCVESERQAVVGVLLDCLEKSQEELGLPLILKLRWIGLVQVMESTYQIHCERAQELTRLLNAAGFKCCVLKGVGIAQYYPAPARRQCGDIDLWVDGNRKDIMAWLRSHYELEHVEWHHIGVNCFEDVPVEIHVHPAWMYHPIHNIRLQKWFSAEQGGAARDVQFAVDERLGFACPSAEFNAVYSLVHVFHHLVEEGVGMRHVVDFYYVLRKLRMEKNGSNTQEVVEVIRHIGLYKFLGAMMWVLNYVCGIKEEELLCEPNEKEGRFLLDEIMLGGNFGQHRRDKLQRNSVARLWALLSHYPSEVLWVVPWKVWHWWWRVLTLSIRVGH